MSIIISQSGKHAQKIDKSEFEKEDYLQNYIHENPESIPIYEIAEDKRLFVVAREFSTESGPIDALAIDKDGDIYIVETKLYKNPDKRTVVAQALDYGASLWKHLNDFGEFINILDEEVQDKFKLSFSEKIKEFFGLEDEQVNLLFDSMKNNLRDGNLKFVILMDSMDERLRDLIIYVNQNSQFDIFAVELEYYKFKDYEIMIPKMFGVEVKKNIKTSVNGIRKEWNEEEFIKQSRELLGSNADKIIELYNFFKVKADQIRWGTGNVNGSFAPIFHKIYKTISPFSIYSDGSIRCKFGWLANKVPTEILEKYYRNFANELEKNTDLKVPSSLKEADFSISGQEFIKNFEGIFKAMKKISE